EARQGGVEGFAQAAADLAFDQRGAGEQPQPQTQFRFMVAGTFGDLGFGVERSRDIRHHASPPVTARVVPVTAAASAEHKKTTDAATSDGCTSRPIGRVFTIDWRSSSAGRPVFSAARRISAWIISVSVKLGHTALTV